MKQALLIIFALLLVSACENSDVSASISIGLVADPQYANEEASGKRLYRESIWKLKEALDTFNLYEVDAVQTLGDVIDKNWSSYDSILPVYDYLKSEIPSYHALGNHDFSIDSSFHPQILSLLKMPKSYYSYTIKDWRFIVLDATDIAFYTKSLHKRSQNEIDKYLALAKSDSNDKPWNGAIGEEQKEWLNLELLDAEQQKQSVILYAHHPIQPQGESHNIWNDHEIIKILEGSNSVFAYINGHNHAGGYQLINGIHYITIFGMVDTEIASYAILNIYQDSIVLNGYGNQKSLKLVP